MENREIEKNLGISEPESVELVSGDTSMVRLTPLVEPKTVEIADTAKIVEIADIAETAQVAKIANTIYTEEAADTAYIA